MSRREHGWGGIKGGETAKAPAKKKTTKKKRRTKAPAKKKDNFDFGLDDEDDEKPGDKVMAQLDKSLAGTPSYSHDLDEAPVEPEDEATRVAQRLGIDLSMECPVCRSLSACDCTEEERSFKRRIAFIAGEDAVPCCDRCGGALSCVLLPRAGCSPPFDLIHMTPVWGCAHCHGASLATVLALASRGK